MKIKSIHITENGMLMAINDGGRVQQDWSSVFARDPEGVRIMTDKGTFVVTRDTPRGDDLKVADIGEATPEDISGSGWLKT